MMLYALTLITAPRQPHLLLWAETCCTALRQAGYSAEIKAVLSADEAADLAVTAAPEAERVLRELATAALAEHPVDLILQPTAGRRKKFLLADMESTIIEQEMLEEMADAIDARAAVTEITQRAMNGEIDFATSLKARVALFAGSPASLLETMEQRITLMSGAANLVSTMRKNGATCWLASGGFRFFTSKLAAQLGFARDYANQLDVSEGRLTGAVVPPILDRQSKAEILRRGCEELQLEISETVVVGDGANDLAMIELCNQHGGLGIAFRAKPAVRAASKHTISHGDLRALLFAQGYSSN
jgi:phosphoserine phosphatase